MKPTADPHYSAYGANIASDPTGAAYTPAATTNPAQTSVAAFQGGGAQALEVASDPAYWSSSESGAAGAFAQFPAGSYAGLQTDIVKTDTTPRVRPVRRFVL